MKAIGDPLFWLQKHTRTRLLMDEAAFQPEAGEAYDAAVPVCQKIIVVSSAGPGWFADFVTDEL
jgi:hypothetical protein